MLAVAMEEDCVRGGEVVINVFLKALKMLHLVALDRTKVIEAAYDAMLAALHKFPVFDDGVLVIKVKLRTELVRIVAIRAYSMVEFNHFLKLVLT